MTISDLITHLENIRQQYGDISVDGDIDCFVVDRREYGGELFLKVRSPWEVEQG